MNNLEKIKKAGFKVLKAGALEPSIEELEVDFKSKTIMSWWGKAYQFKTKKQRDQALKKMQEDDPKVLDADGKSFKDKVAAAGFKILRLDEYYHRIKIWVSDSAWKVYEKFESSEKAVERMEQLLEDDKIISG